MYLGCCWLQGGDWCPQSTQSEALNWPNAQLVTTQSCCKYWHKDAEYLCVMSSLCPISFLAWRCHCPIRPQQWPSLILTQIHQESADHWRWVPTGAVVKQTPFIAAITTAHSVHSLHKTMLSPLFCLGLTLYICVLSPSSHLKLSSSPTTTVHAMRGWHITPQPPASWSIQW